MDFVYKFPVVRGVQARREYYIAMVPLKMIARLFPNDEEYVLPEYRAQRKLNEARVPIISSVCSTKPLPKSRTTLDTRGERLRCFEFDEMDGI
ncbi:MAG: DNA sulfur modification protein DndB [Lachnospiraceae bacterium]|nr:DNA sulfur modification protein DndB [Lachnospiraceae bacterium]MCH4067153.1 DNA sulfur modification protein DndB [Lachnospiraceae bacterium]MCH4113179.1 DNA sulfur modification protein DndB [Lachnospiraceae bacterium]